MMLSTREWARIEILFPQASELAGTERARFLERECAQDPAVRSELEAMLAAADGENKVLDAPIALGARTQPAAEQLPAGTRLGSWKIKSLIGHGGMGEVYLAERADGAYAMSAAIKLLKRELFSYTNAQRFLRERRVLARLSHPNIARVLDAGTTDDGRPYLVMEYVDGARITDHANARALAPRDAARLMLAVAEAVAEAHRHGVVHRDLKPANVMVTADEQVKLLDFGIAKLMDEDDRSVQGVVPMTLAYAAPEQILGQALAPATDIYALGVMLFQLLTHRLPHTREGLPLPVIAAGLRDETVERPSKVVLATEGLFGETSRRRQAQALSGDLDWIALKALQSDPKRRYPSAGEFADDLRRYLEHRPVLAHQDSVVYRASRFVRRYPTQVLAAGVAIVALAVGLAVALSEARIARAEAVRAQRVEDFVLSLFREQDPVARRQAEALSPAELIARGVARADEELQAEPDLHAKVLNDLGDIEVALGDPAKGRATLERVLAQLRAQGKGDSLEAAETLRRIAQANDIEGLYKDEDARLREAWSILEAHDAKQSLEAARVQLQLGFLGDYGKPKGRETAAHFLEAQRIFERQLGPDARDTIRAIFYRGMVLDQGREDADAMAAQRDAISRIERAYGPDSAQLIAPMWSLASVLGRNGAYDEADATFARAVALQRRHYGPVHQQLFDLLRGWANLEQDRDAFDKAERLFNEAEAALPAGVLDRRGELLKDRGQLFLDLRRYADAEQNLSEAVAVYRKVQGEGSGFTWFVTSEWGRALAGMKRLDEAERVQRHALERLGAILGPETYQNTLIADGLADTLDERGKFQEAAELRRRSLALTLKKYSPDHRLAAIRQASLAGDLLRLGPAATAEAANLLDLSIASLRKIGNQPLTLAEALTLRGRAYVAGRDAAAARAAFEEAIGLLQKLPGSETQLTDARRQLAALH